MCLADIQTIDCHACAGSGQGMYDGARCRVCNGCGVVAWEPDLNEMAKDAFKGDEVAQGNLQEFICNGDSDAIDYFSEALCEWLYEHMPKMPANKRDSFVQTIWEHVNNENETT